MFLGDENENNDNDGSANQIFFSLMVSEIVLHPSYMLLPIQRSEVRLSSSLGADEVALKDTVNTMSLPYSIIVFVQVLSRQIRFSCHPAALLHHD